MKKKYSIKEASEILGLSKDTLYNKVKRKEFESIKEKGRIYIFLEDTKDLKNEDNEELKKLQEENAKLKAKIQDFKNKFTELKLKKTKKEYIKFSKFCQKHNITKEKQKILKDKIAKNFKKIDFIKIKDGKFFIKNSVELSTLLAL